MSHELLYTSAQRGLRPGSRGFCTVMQTEGLAPQMIERLEALSNYRHVFPPGDPQAGRNPVVYSHVRIQDRMRPISVLSRVADYGLDYSNRTNNLAHHVLLEPSERAAGGPAWLLAQPSVMQTEWDGQVVLKHKGRTIPMGDPPIGPARRWKELAGDAGWGGVLAEVGYTDPNRFVFVIFQPGQELLPLFSEAIALLPASKRWDVTFMTYVTGPLQDVRCSWRGVLKGSPEEASARRYPNALILDLTQPLGAPHPGRFVEAARTGVLPPHLKGDAPPSLPGSGPESKSRSAPAEARDEIYRLVGESDSTSLPRAKAALSTRPPARMGEAPLPELPPELPPALAPAASSTATSDAGLHWREHKEILALAALVMLALVGIAVRLALDYRSPASDPALTSTHDLAAGTSGTPPVAPGAGTGASQHEHPQHEQGGEDQQPPRERTPGDGGGQRPAIGGGPRTPPRELEIPFVIASGGVRDVAPEAFVEAYRRHHDDPDPGPVTKLVPFDVEGKPLVRLELHERDHHHMRLRAERLEPGSADRSERVGATVHFEHAGPQRFWLNVTVQQTRFVLVLDRDSLSGLEVSDPLERLREAEFKVPGTKQVQWNASRGELTCEFQSRPEKPLQLEAEFSRGDVRFIARFQATLSPPRFAFVSLQRRDEPKRTPAPRVGPVQSLAAALRDGHCHPEFVELSQAPVRDGAAHIAEFSARLAAPRYTLFQPRDNTLTVRVQDDACEIQSPNDFQRPRLGSFQVVGEGRRLQFKTDAHDLRSLPTLPECALRIAGSEDRLLIFAQPAEVPGTVAVAKEQKEKGLAVTLPKDRVVRGREFTTWKLFLLDPQRLEQNAWLELTGKSGSSYQLQTDRMPGAQEIALENVVFKLVAPEPNAADPQVKFSVTYPDEWGLKSTRDRLVSELASESGKGDGRDDKRIARLNAQLAFLDLVYPRAEGESPRPAPKFQLFALGYSELQGPSQPDRGPEDVQKLLVLRAVVGISLSDLRKAATLGERYLALPVGREQP